MNSVIHSAALVAVMSICTIALRFLPFVIFKDKVPPYIVYLGRVLPSAIIGMLVVYCLRETPLLSAPHGIPELIALITVGALQAYKRNSLLSILSGTVVYMLLIQLVF